MGTRFLIILFLCCVLSSCAPSPDASIQIQDDGTPTGRFFIDGEFQVERVQGGLQMIDFSISESPFDTYSTFHDTFIPDPSSVEGFTVVLPYNYTTTLKSASRYFSTCIEAGFEVVDFNQDNQHVEMTLEKDDVLLRLVVFETKLKIYAKGLEKEVWR